VSHPFINPAEIQKLSLEDIHLKITDLTKKLNFAHTTHNRALIFQVGMALESYREASHTKLASIEAERAEKEKNRFARKA
jgi:hypothetical protein